MYRCGRDVRVVPQILNSANTLFFLILALYPLSAEVYSCGPLKESDVYWNLCGCAAADQAHLRLNLPTEPHLKMLPGRAEKGGDGR